MKGNEEKGIERITINEKEHFDGGAGGECGDVDCNNKMINDASWDWQKVRHLFFGFEKHIFIWQQLLRFWRCPNLVLIAVVKDLFAQTLNFELFSVPVYAARF